MLKKSKEDIIMLMGTIITRAIGPGKRVGGGVVVYVGLNMSVQNLAEYKTTHSSAYWFMYRQLDCPPKIYSVIYHPPKLNEINSPGRPTQSFQVT